MGAMGRVAIVILYAASCLAQAAQTCKIAFSVVAKDDLNNIRQGFTPKTLEWYQKKMAKKYPDVCYSTEASPVVLFFAARPAIYHGTQIASEPSNATVTNSSGAEVGQIHGTTESTVPYEVEYQVLYLSIETKLPDGSWKVAHNFSGKTLHPTMYGFCTHNCHPIYANIESAVKWLHDGGLNDPTQSMLP